MSFFSLRWGEDTHPHIFSQAMAAPACTHMTVNQSTLPKVKLQSETGRNSFFWGPTTQDPQSKVLDLCCLIE